MSRSIGLDFGLPGIAQRQQTDASWLDNIPSWVRSMFRDYQDKLVCDIAIAMRKHRRILCQAPCRSGKTTVFCGMTSAATDSGLTVLILATRTKLIRQISERLDSMNITHGVIAADMPGHSMLSSRVQVSSVDTIYRRCIVDNKMPLPTADVIIFDEAHLACGTSRQRILNSYPNAWKFGFTATPAGKRLRDQFDALVIGPGITELIESGALVKPRIFNKELVSEAQLKKLKRKANGDYHDGEASKLMNRPKIVGDVVANWLRIASNDATMVFACDKAHGADLLIQFSNAGVPCEMITDQDDDGTREDVLRRGEAGITKVIINCFLLSYGVDVPWVRCIVLARPMRSIIMYLQTAWRGGTPYKDKDHFKIIDHGRVISSLRSPVYDRDWTLDTKSCDLALKLESPQVRKKLEEQPMHCPECSCEWLVTEEGNKCPNTDCNWIPKPIAKPVNVVDVDIGESPEDLPPVETLQEFFQQACWWYAQRWPERWEEKPNSGRFWSWVQTRTKYKRPSDERMPSKFWKLDRVPSSPEVAGWLKSQQIRYAKSRSREQPPSNTNQAAA